MPVNTLIPELVLRACPICHAPNSLVLTKAYKAGDLYIWYQCRACDSALLSLDDGCWSYQHIGREDQAHLLKRPLTPAELQALVAQDHDLSGETTPTAGAETGQAPGLPAATPRGHLQLPTLIAGTMIANVLFLAATFFLALVKSIVPVPSPTPITPTPAVYYRWTSAQVVQAFQQAGLEASSPRAMTRQDYGLAPRLATEGTTFLLPSLCDGCSGQVMSFDNLADLLETWEYYARGGARLGAGSGDWLFVTGNILVQISSDLPAAGAEQYQGALNTLAGTISGASPPGPAGCQPDSLGYLDRLQPLVLQFADTLAAAERGPLGSRDATIAQLQSIESAAAGIPAPPCARSAAALWLQGAGRVIDGLAAWSEREHRSGTNRQLELGRLETDNGLAQLVALAAGQPVPTPRPLPTATPIPTPQPTPTALRLTSPMVVGRWRIVVQKVDTAISITSPYGNQVERADGRFALVFMDVTNIGPSADTFVAFASLAVQDANGRRYEENVVATHYAQGIYHTDLAVDVAPQQSVYLVAVYDISKSSRFYTLVPGALGNQYHAGVRLYIP